MAKKQDNAVTFLSVMADLKAGVYKPFYLLMGAESYYVDLIAKYILDHALPETERDFNQMVLYGAEVTAAAVIDQARRYPMMAERQVVVVREAQNIRQLELFSHYLKRVMPSTVLVICYAGKSVDKRSVFYKTAVGVPDAVVFESDVIREEDAPAWVDAYAREKGAELEPEAAMLLADCLGANLRRLANEVDKLCLQLPEGKRSISTAMVEASVGVNREFSPFALCKYISAKDFGRVQYIAGYMALNPKAYPLVVLLSVLQMHFNRIMRYHCIKKEQPSLNRYAIAPLLKMNPYFMGEVEQAARHYSFAGCLQCLRLIRETDSRYKSNERGMAQDGDLLMELLCKIQMS